MKLQEKIIITGVITAESGIMIGGSNSAIEIGGTDKQVIRNPITKLPYIPGSSLKGKMRSLLEQTTGQIADDKGPTHNPSHISAQLFGHINRNEQRKQQPSRVIVRDSELTNSEKMKNTELLYTEVKAENSINRITAEANPRFFERVPKGAEFGFEIIINVFDIDAKGSEFLKYVCNCLRLVQDDYLGGSGSRGNGKVSFKINKIISRNLEFYTTGNNEEYNVKEQYENLGILKDLLD